MQDNKMKSQRKIKIQPFIFPGTSDRKMKVIPVITLKGDWLQAAGFFPEHHVQISIEPNRIIIEKQ